MPQRTVRKKRSRRDFMWFCLFVIVVCGIIIARQEEKKRLDDLKYIEKLAREDHNMVGKDEVPLFIVDDKENGAEQKNKDAESKNR